MGPLSGGALPAPRAVALRLEIGPCAADPDAPATSRAQIAMPVWDDLLNCVCQNGPQRPGIQEVLDTLQRNTVCTGTQCFETEADAFGLTAAPSTVQPNSMFFMLMMCAARVLRSARASHSP